MARATKALITRQDLIDMANEGLILLRPGSGIENSGEYINRVLTREEIVQYTYIDGTPFNPEDGSGTFGIKLVSTGPESFGPVPGFSFDIVTKESFVQGPIIDGKRANGGSVISTSVTVPTDKKRMTHYGIDARFADYIVSPAVNAYGETVHINNQRTDQGLFTATLTVGKSGTTPTATYSRSSVGSTDLSGNIRLGNLVNFSLVPPSVWPTAGTLILEVFENSVLQYSKSLAIAGYSTGSLSITNYPIRFGINYEFKGRSSMVTEFTGAFSNVTGQRACNLL